MFFDAQKFFIFDEFIYFFLGSTNFWQNLSTSPFRREDKSAQYRMRDWAS